MTKIGVACMLCLLCVGCITKRGLEKPDDSMWAVGRTVRLDVVKKWGNPDSIRGTTWVWKDWQVIGAKFRLGYMGVGFSASNTRLSTREYRLKFDEEGRLVSKEVSDSVPGGVAWSANPWD